MSANFQDIKYRESWENKCNFSLDRFGWEFYVPQPKKTAVAIDTIDRTLLFEQ